MHVQSRLFSSLLSSPLPLPFYPFLSVFFPISFAKRSSNSTMVERGPGPSSGRESIFGIMLCPENVSGGNDFGSFYRTKSSFGTSIPPSKFSHWIPMIPTTQPDTGWGNMPPCGYAIATVTTTVTFTSRNS